MRVSIGGEGGEAGWEPSLGSAAGVVKVLSWAIAGAAGCDAPKSEEEEEGPKREFEAADCD